VASRLERSGSTILPFDGNERDLLDGRPKAGGISETGISPVKTGLGQRGELGLVRSERAPEICSTKRRLHEKTERKNPKTSLSFVVLLKQQKLRQG
jgi:hypothetical protein